MEQNMEDEMRKAWDDRHHDMSETDRPGTNPSFERGFGAAVDLLMPLLEMAAPHVFASAGAAHMMDGFKPKRLPIDEFVERIKAVLPNVKYTPGKVYI